MQGGFAALGMLEHAVPLRLAARAQSRVQALEPASAVGRRQAAVTLPAHQLKLSPLQQLPISQDLIMLLLAKVMVY